MLGRKAKCGLLGSVFQVIKSGTVVLRHEDDLGRRRTLGDATASLDASDPGRGVGEDSASKPKNVVKTKVSGVLR